MASEKITYTICPCCSANNIRYLFTAKDYVATKEIFEIWGCDNCTVRFTQHIPDASEIVRYYDSANYMSHSTDTKGWFNKLYQSARKYSVWWRYRKVKKATRLNEGKLLDIGTGTGAFPFFMKGRNWDVTAVEPDEASRVAALKYYQLAVQPMDAIKKYSNKSFNVITLWHVLEHVHDLHFYLQQIDRLLTDDGTLFIAVPNYKSTDAHHYEEYWDAYDVPRHLFHFSPQALQQLLIKHGFVLTKQTSFWLDPFYACLQSEEHQTGEKNLVSASWNGLKSSVTGMLNTQKASAVTYIFKKEKRTLVNA